MHILFDIGGTNMRFAVSHDEKTIGVQKTVSTPQNYSLAMPLIKDVIEELCGDARPDHAAGCISGAWKDDRTSLLWSPNLREWEQRPVRDDLASIIGCVPELENDADVAGLGEARYGAGKKHSIVMYLTISTGIGGTRIVDGKIDRNVFGFEPGHQIIKDQYTLEELASGSGLFARFNRRPEDMETEEHDFVWDETAQLLGRGIRNSILHWSPDIVVLGGSMILKSRCRLYERVSLCISKEVKNLPFSPDVEKAALGGEAGLWGSLALISRSGE